jgi:hypothetical protein
MWDGASAHFGEFERGLERAALERAKNVDQRSACCL